MTATTAHAGPSPLKRWLFDTGHTVSGLADQACITRVHMSRIVNRRADPGPDLARRLAQITGLSLDAILGPDRPDAGPPCDTCNPTTRRPTRQRETGGDVSPRDEQRPPKTP